MSTFRNLLHIPLPEPLVNVDFKETQSQDTFTQYFAFDESILSNSIGVEFTEITPTTISGHFTSTTCSIIIGTPLYKGIETGNFTQIKFPFYFYTRAMDGLDLYAYNFVDDKNQINVDGSVKVGLSVYNIPNSYKYLEFVSTAATVGNYFTLTQFPFTGVDAFCVNGYNLSEIERLNPASGYSIVCQSILPEDAESSVILGSSPLYLEAGKTSMGSLNFENGDPDVDLSSFGESMPTYIGNSKECINLSEETFPLPEKGTESVSNLQIGDTSKSGLVSSVAVWNRDYPVEDLKQWYEDNCIPLPAVYYDINKQLLQNQGNYGTDYFIDFSGNNLHAVVQNLNPVSPDWVFNSWKFYSDVIEATSPYGGVFHVTKLLKNQKRATVFFINLNDFVGFNSKISIFINKPAGKENASDATFSMGDISWAETPFTQTLTEGVNVIDIPSSNAFDSQYTNIARVIIPDDWWDQDENGIRLETNTDFYIVFFPVYDQSKAVGYPTRAVSDFTNNDWNEMSTSNNVSIINYYKVDTTECSKAYNFRNTAATNIQYSTSNVFVIRPFKARFKRTDGSKNIGVSINLHGLNNGEDVLIKIFHYQSSTGEITVDFPGAVVFSESSYTNPVALIFLYHVGVFEQLPLETYFQFDKLQTDSGYTGAVIPSGPQYQTVIMELEVSNNVYEGVNVVNFYKNNSQATGTDVTLQMNGPNSQAMGTELAFSKNNSGKVYINGVLDTTHLMSEYFNKHITVAVVGTNTETSNTQKYIGATDNGGESPFRLHKFMAFKEQLTEEQLKKVYEKYDFYMGN